MDHKEAHHLRLYVLAALFFIVAAVYIGVLYDTQVNNYDYYYASSVRSIARWELSSSTINIIGGVLISYLLASGGNRSGRPPFRKGVSQTPRRYRCRTRRIPPGGNAIPVFSILPRRERGNPPGRKGAPASLHSRRRSYNPIIVTPPQSSALFSGATAKKEGSGNPHDARLSSQPVSVSAHSCS